MGWGTASSLTAGTFRAGQEAVGEDMGTAPGVKGPQKGIIPLGQRSPTFWHRALVSWKTIFPRMGVRTVSGGMHAMGGAADKASLTCCAAQFLSLLPDSTTGWGSSSRAWEPPVGWEVQGVLAGKTDRAGPDVKRQLSSFCNSPGLEMATSQGEVGVWEGAGLA